MPAHRDGAAQVKYQVSWGAGRAREVALRVNPMIESPEGQAGLLAGETWAQVLVQGGAGWVAVERVAVRKVPGRWLGKGPAAAVAGGCRREPAMACQRCWWPCQRWIGGSCAGKKGKCQGMFRAGQMLGAGWGCAHPDMRHLFMGARATNAAGWGYREPQVLQTALSCLQNENNDHGWCRAVYSFPEAKNGSDSCKPPSYCKLRAGFL